MSVMELTEDQLEKTSSLLDQFVDSAEAKEVLLEAVRANGLIGVSSMRVVGSLQRKLLVKPGLYQKMIQLNEEIAKPTSDPEGSKKKADKQDAVAAKKAAAAKGEDVTKPKKGGLPEYSPLPGVDERFNPEAYAEGVKYLEAAPKQSVLKAPAKSKPFVILNLDEPLKPSEKILPWFKNPWDRHTPGSIVFDMLVDEADGIHPDELTAVVGKDAIPMLKKYTTNWRYMGWFVGFNETNGRFRLFWIDPDVKYPDQTKHPKHPGK